MQSAVGESYIFEVWSLAVAVCLAFGPGALGGNEKDSEIGGCEHSHDHGMDDDDNEATESDEDDDDNDSEATETLLQKSILRGT